MKVLAIDPGYERLGVAVVEKTKKGKDILLYSDCFRTDPKDIFEERLLQIGNEVERIIKRHHPHALAIEQLYFNTNQKTAMNVAEARGVICFICRKHNLVLFEYTPLQIKNAVSGYGRSTKEQIAKMIPHLVEIQKKIQFDDEYDLALHFLRAQEFYESPNEKFRGQPFNIWDYIKWHSALIDYFTSRKDYHKAAKFLLENGFVIRLPEKVEKYKAMYCTIYQGEMYRYSPRKRTATGFDGNVFHYCGRFPSGFRYKVCS